MSVPSRTIAIGDIHGCSDALTALIDVVKPTSADVLVALGDYIDRGPNSSGVLDQLLELQDRCELIPLIGNHEEALLNGLRDSAVIPKWLNLGGADTLRSYGWQPGGPRRSLAEWFPKRHLEFLQRCREYHETTRHLFVHAGYVDALPIDEQPPLALHWRVTDAQSSRPHCSGKTVIVGHTPQHSGEVLDLGFLICIDTNCVRGGWLTALDVDSRVIWQVDRGGRLRQAQPV